MTNIKAIVKKIVAACSEEEVLEILQECRCQCQGDLQKALGQELFSKTKDKKIWYRLMRMFSMSVFCEQIVEKILENPTKEGLIAIANNSKEHAEGVLKLLIKPRKDLTELDYWELTRSCHSVIKRWAGEKYVAIGAEPEKIIHAMIWMGPAAFFQGWSRLKELGKCDVVTIDDLIASIHVDNATCISATREIWEFLGQQKLSRDHYGNLLSQCASCGSQPSTYGLVREIWERCKKDGMEPNHRPFHFDNLPPNIKEELRAIQMVGEKFDRRNFSQISGKKRGRKPKALQGQTTLLT